MRIFVTVGTQKYRFDRSIKECDKIAKNSENDFRIQYGSSKYKIQFSTKWDYLNRSFFLEEMRMADVVICHCGTGILFEALEMGKKVIVVPRLKKYGEHKNNHQLEMFEYVKKRNYCLCILDIKELHKAIVNIDKMVFEIYSSKNREIFCENLKKILGV